MMMVPVMTLLLSQRGVEPGLAVKMAIATSMATILFTSLSSVRAHHPGRRALGPGRAAGAGHRARRPAGGRRGCLRCSRARGWRCSSRSSSASRRCRCCATAPAPGRRCPAARARPRWAPASASCRVGRRRRGLHVGALHDLVQRAGAPGRGHQRGAGLPHRRWPAPWATPSAAGACRRAARRRGLPLPAGAGRGGRGQHEPGPAGRARGAAHRRGGNSSACSR
jgi:hypothetical protein